jgi:adenine-specific DNA-methyltransferase
MGSKLRLLDFIIPKIEEAVPKGRTIVDLMAGTHSIGYALKRNYSIISSDIQEYSYTIGQAIIENNTKNITLNDFEKDIISKRNDNKEYDLFNRLYKDTYFSKKQCEEIDSVRYSIDTLKDKNKKSLYLTLLMYAMGYCQSSAGHFAQYMPKDHPRLKKLRNLSIIDAMKKKISETEIIFSKYENKVYLKDYRDLLSDENIKKLKGTKLVYIDPPYSEAQYSRFYHLLETAVKYDYPDVKHKGLYRSDRFQSAFCSKKTAPEEFKFIASKVKEMGSYLAISYSDKGLLTVKEIEDICLKYFSNVKVYKQIYKHSMQGRGMTKHLNEVLIICK